jgi:RimJ/RimL family protein N-acetyltransferase
MNEIPADPVFLDFKCPHCRRSISFIDDRIGLPQECPLCFEVVVVPPPNEEYGRPMPLPVETDRVVLRRFAHSDWKGLLELMSCDAEAFRHLDWGPMDEAQVLDWIEKDRGVHFTQPGVTLELAIARRDNPQLIGLASLFFLEDSLRQIGFQLMVHPDHHRQGIATEAVTGILDFAFRRLNLHRVATVTDLRNVAACRMLEKAGLRREGECLKAKFQKGEWIGTALHACLREERR